MKSACKIYNIGLGKLKIVDTTEGFMPEQGQSEVSSEQYKRSECKVFDIIKYHPVNLENSEIGDIIAYEINEGEIEIDISVDGYYEICHLIIPTETNPNKGKYYFKDNVLYNEDSGQECTQNDIKILSEVNLGEFAQCVKDVFYTKFLQECYINVCKKLFASKINKCALKQQSTFDRDFLWMTLNILKYYSELGQLSEAQRLLEELKGCYLGNMCTSRSTISSSSNCNCNE